MYCAHQGHEKVEASLKTCSEFNEVVKKVGLHDFHLRKPILDGKAVCDIYEIKPGKIMKPLMDE